MFQERPVGVHEQVPIGKWLKKSGGWGECGISAAPFSFQINAAFGAKLGLNFELLRLSWIEFWTGQIEFAQRSVTAARPRHGVWSSVLSVQLWVCELPRWPT